MAERIQANLDRAGCKTLVLEAMAWCGAHGLQTTMKFPVRMGREEAYCLAKAWAERMEFLYLSSTEGLLATPQLARETLQGYRESAD